MITATTAAVAAGIAAVGAVGAGTISSINAKNNLERQIAYNDKQNALSRQWANEDWEKQVAYAEHQNWYNSPSNQKTLYNEAGYNFLPSGPYTAASAGSVATPTAMSSSAFTDTTAQFQNAINSAIGSAVSSLGAINTWQKTENEIATGVTQRANYMASTGQLDQQTQYLLASTTGLNIQNEINSATSEAQKASILNNSRIIGAKYEEVNMSNKLMQNAVDNNPRFWKHQRRMWQGEEFSMKCSNRIADVEASIRETYGMDAANASLTQMRQTIKQNIESLKGMRVYNSEEYLQAQKNIIQAVAECNRNAAEFSYMNELNKSNLIEKDVTFSQIRNELANLDKIKAEARYDSSVKCPDGVTRSGSELEQYINAVQSAATISGFKRDDAVAGFESQSWYVGLNHGVTMCGELFGIAAVGRAINKYAGGARSFAPSVSSNYSTGVQLPPSQYGYPTNFQYGGF